MYKASLITLIAVWVTMFLPLHKIGIKIDGFEPKRNINTITPGALTQYNVVTFKEVSLVDAPKAPLKYSSTTIPDNSDAKMYIYIHESGNNPGSINITSGACGLGQALPCSKMPCSLNDYSCQDIFFTSYMKGRYGTWENARNFWQINHYW